jgi:hypothetical protein
MARRSYPLNFDDRTREYLGQFQTECERIWGEGKTSTELATRPLVHMYLQEVILSLQPLCLLEHDSVVTGTSNRPDWIFSNPDNFGIYCYADHKGLKAYSSYNLSAVESNQIDRYLAMGRPVFVFDGMEFLFFEGDRSSLERISLVSKSGSKGNDWSSMEINPAVEVKLRELFNAAGFRPWTESDLVIQLALRARAMSESIAEYLQLPEGSGFDDAENELIEALQSLREMVVGHHDPGLANNESCADFVAQVLIFGLFYAHTKSLVVGNEPSERKLHIDGFWAAAAWSNLTNNLKPFGAVHKILSSQLAQNNAISSWYLDAMALLSHAEYMGSQPEPTDYHSLFEAFLDKFDNNIRFERGAFFTPQVLTQWMVSATDQLSIRYFGNPMVRIAEKIIDPCCGTGGYIESLLKDCDFTGVPYPTLVGFEVLPGPYALAKYRIDQVSLELGIAPTVDILMTDTLADQLENPRPESENGFSKEQAKASSHAQPPITIVIGNPPSSDTVASDAPRTIIEAMMDDYRPEKSSIRGRQNIQQGLSNEAYRFLRWSTEKVLKTGAGIVSLIMPGSIATSVSFSKVRQWLDESFDAVYVLIFDQDGRADQRGNSLFDVLQGRLVLMCVKLDGSTEKVNGQIHIEDIAGRSMLEKHEFLTKSENILSTFTRTTVRTQDHRWAQGAEFDEILWGKCWPLLESGDVAGIFNAKCSGTKLAPTHLLFHTDENVLRRRSIAVGSKSKGTWTKSYDELVEGWWSGQQKVPSSSKFSDGVRERIKESVGRKSDSISRYIYRPFQPGFCLKNELLYQELGKTPGDGTRRRPELIAAFNQGAIGICVAPSTEDLGSSLHRFVSFADAIPDNDNVSRGNAMVFCDRFPQMKTKKDVWNDTAVDNISNEFHETIGSQHSPEDAVYYVYAVMNSAAYLGRFGNILYGPSDPANPQRVPVLRDNKALRRIINLGREMAAYEMGHADAPILEGLETDIPAGFPGFELKAAKIDSLENKIVLGDASGTSITCTGIPSEVLSLDVSGHNVVKKWLRERTYKYLRRPFIDSDLHSLLQLISNIDAQGEKLSEVSDILNPCLEAGELHRTLQLNP